MCVCVDSHALPFAVMEGLEIREINGNNFYIYLHIYQNVYIYSLVSNIKALDNFLGGVFAGLINK